MIDKFKKNHWYRFNGKANSVCIDSTGYPNVEDNEKFMMDGKWHQCKERGIFQHTGYFYDSSVPGRLCLFRDYTKPKGEDLYMFDELSPVMYNIKKLKELNHDQ